MIDSQEKDAMLETTRTWVSKFVIEHNLCPFARREFDHDRIRFLLSETEKEAQLLEVLAQALHGLKSNSAVETTLIIHPFVLRDFFVYNQFLEKVDGLIEALGFEGEFQVASFHPQYQFAGTDFDDAENYTNRSPYPMLHILREASLETALEQYPNAQQIPDRNIKLMNELGAPALKKQLDALIQ